VDVRVSRDELGDAARLARESVVVGRAVALARWLAGSDGEEPEPFSLAEVNRELAALGRAEE
jgi:hypothetical protein